MIVGYHGRSRPPLFAVLKDGDLLLHLLAESTCVTGLERSECVETTMILEMLQIGARWAEVLCVLCNGRVQLDGDMCNSRSDSVEFGHSCHLKQMLTRSITLRQNHASSTSMTLGLSDICRRVAPIHYERRSDAKIRFLWEKPRIV